MSVDRSFPPDLVIEENMKRGEKRPGMKLLTFPSGKFGGRDFSERASATYQLALTDLLDDTDKLRQLVAFANHVKVQLTPFWLMEAIQKTHLKQPCDLVGDGSRTTFFCPFRPTDAAALTAGHFFVAGAPQFSGYSTHMLSNLLTDDQASAVAGTTGSEKVGAAGTLTKTDMVSADGLTCFKVTPSGSGAHGVQQTDAACTAAVVGQDYTAHAGLSGVGTFRAGIEFLTSGYATIGSIQYSSTFTGSETEFQYATKTYTAPATTVFARCIAERSSSSSAVVFADCLGILPGDLTRWFLPSAAPCAVEFATAPTTNQRVEAAIAGQLLALVRLMNPELSWSEILEGDALVRRLKMQQDFE